MSGVPITVTAALARGFELSVQTPSTNCFGGIGLLATGQSGIQANAAGLTASGTLAGYEFLNCEDSVPITGTFSAQGTTDSGTPPAATVQTTSGSVSVLTPLSSQPLTAGSSVSAGSLVQTGADGSATLTFSGGTSLSLARNSQVTILPPTLPSGDDIVLNQITGVLIHAVVNTVASQPDHYKVLTPTATIRPTGTDFTTGYSQSGAVGSTVVSVQSGTVQVTSPGGQVTSLSAGAQAAFDDFLPRVIPILPVDQSSLVGGRVNTFSWTSFPGAAGYLFEYTLDPLGFAQANSGVVESSLRTIRVLPPAFTQTAGTVAFPIVVPGGILPVTVPAWWRVFPTDAAGLILPGSTASDASRAFIQ